MSTEMQGPISEGIEYLTRARETLVQQANHLQVVGRALTEQEQELVKTIGEVGDLIDRALKLLGSSRQ